MPKKRNQRKQLYVSNIVAPLIIIILAGILSIGVSDRFTTELTSRFKNDATTVIRLATNSLDKYRDLLYSGRAFVASSDNVTNLEWQTFYAQQAIFQRYKGVSSVAYVKSVPTSDVAKFEAKMKSPDYFGSTFSIRKQSSRPIHGYVSATASQSDMSAILGKDLLAEDDRYEVYKKAEMTGSIVSSPQVRLATGYDGFFNILPVYKQNVLDGYVLTSFRTQVLMKELFNDDSFGYKVVDVTAKPIPLYENDFNANQNVLSQKLEVGGRTFKVEISRPIEKKVAGYLLPAGIMATAVIMAATLYAYSLRPRNQQRY